MLGREGKAEDESGECQCLGSRSREPVRVEALSNGCTEEHSTNGSMLHAQGLEGEGCQIKRPKSTQNVRVRKGCRSPEAASSFLDEACSEVELERKCADPGFP